MVGQQSTTDSKASSFSTRRNDEAQRSPRAGGDEKQADDCWRAVEVAFAHQTENGDFGDPAESVAFWLCELNRSLLVLQESPLAEHNKERINALEA